MSVPAAEALTHWAPHDTPRRGRGRYTEELAICGRYYPVPLFSIDPTCPTCRARRDAFEELSV